MDSYETAPASMACNEARLRRKGPFGATSWLGFAWLASAWQQPARLASALVLSALQAVVHGAAPTYEQHIRPIFRAHCFDCHGATGEFGGSLDLRLVRTMIQGGESGPAIVPGSTEQSYLLARIRSGEMPPGDAKATDAEIAIVEQWIAAGAPTARPEPEQIAPGLGLTPEERSFWSFQRIERPAVPELAEFAAELRVRTPIDALILQNNGPLDQPTDEASSEIGHDESWRDVFGDGPGARFAPDADRRTLVVRAYLNLIGLSPPAEEMQRWLVATSDDWWEQLVDELLASPHYGERWARHWLDVAGYADSDGATAADVERPWAWKYRDWVVRAMNDDKPFDQFITEQLAGDELAGPKEGEWTPAQIELLTATGYLRMAADGTGSGADDAKGRNQVMADVLKIVGTSLLGLSLQCAQCHDHRYDPIPQTDYYALRAVFEPALDWQQWRSPDARRVSLYTAADRQKAAEVESEAQVVVAEREQKQSLYMQQALDQELAKYPEPLSSGLRDAYTAAAESRSEEQTSLLTAYPSVHITPGVLYQYLPEAAEDLKKYDARINEIRAKIPTEEFLHALVEPPQHMPATKLFHRGDAQQPKQDVLPAPLSATTPEGETRSFPLDDEELPTTGRRLALARWLTCRDNPLFARVIVNRVWMHHFGAGLVATPSDFGKLGARPSFPLLLDWLADEFVRQDWSLKQLHRLIMQSTAWRQVRDPRSAFPVALRRLEAEILRDRMLAVSGALDRTLFGPPIPVAEDETGQVTVAGEAPRRSLYIQVRRSRPVPLLQAFDAPVMETNCERRANSTVATQSLMLLNGGFLLEQAARLADRVREDSQDHAASPTAEAPRDATHDADPSLVVRAWRRAYSRDPIPDELAEAMEFIAGQRKTLAAAPEALPTGRNVDQQALTNLCQALLTSNEFLYGE